ncbi:MAG TPA: DNA-formamidopyrimidine glycosylase family protein [Acidimicrobiales bacterium]
MPELPEVRAHAERLTAVYAGATLERVQALSFTALKTVMPPPDAAVGNELVRVTTRGKLLLLDFAPITFVVHLMQGGRLRPDEKQPARPQGGLARWRFDDGRALLLTEAGKDRKAGVWVRDGDPDTQEPLAELGPDADTVSVEQLAAILRAGPSMRLHGFLRDQHGIAGLGRRLANEICHRAKLSPFATSTKLDDEEIARLHDAIGSCIEESLTYERSRDDMSSSKDRPGAVHHRTKQECPVCGDVVRAVEYSAYTVNYCATCQTGGKVLADNTTSRFLK